jgi:putative hydrolase of the HAD superfamily
MQTQIKALVLDFGGVVTRTMFETHDLTEAQLGLSSGTLTWRGPFAPETDPLWQSMQADEISERDYWLQRAMETGKLIGERWTSMVELIQRARGAEPMKIIRPEALEVIELAKAAGFKLAILSNELDLFYGADFRHKLPFLHHFDLIHDATHTKILKPDARAYLDCIEALALAPDECLFVDDQTRNIVAAEHVGMPAVPFDVQAPADSYNTVLAKLGISRKDHVHA